MIACSTLSGDDLNPLKSTVQDDNITAWTIDLNGIQEHLGKYLFYELSIQLPRSSLELVEILEARIYNCTQMYINQLTLESPYVIVKQWIFDPHSSQIALHIPNV